MFQKCKYKTQIYKYQETAKSLVVCVWGGGERWQDRDDSSSSCPYRTVHNGRMSPIDRCIQPICSKNTKAKVQAICSKNIYNKNTETKKTHTQIKHKEVLLLSHLKGNLVFIVGNDAFTIRFKGRIPAAVKVNVTWIRVSHKVYSKCSC